MTHYKSDFLNIMQERGFIYQCTDFDALDQLLATERVTAYTGVDPTGASMHVGHMIPSLMMHWFQKCGHRPLILVGGTTAKIGDPTGKDESRKALTAETVDANIQSLKKPFSKLVNFGDGTGDNDAILVNNADWLEKIGYTDFLRDYGRHFTINRMIGMESVKQRLDRESPLTFLEFNYMIMQGYDFLHLAREYDCRFQLSGSDQWGNVIQGVELGRRVLKKELFGLTAPLLTTSSGKKMGKTEGGAVWLNDDMLPPYDYYQYWRNTEDGDVEKFLKLFTTLPMDEIAKLGALKGAEINEAKKILAFETTKMIHGAEAAELSAKTAAEAFEQGMNAAGLPSITVSKSDLEAGISILQLYRETGLVASGGEAKRLIKGGGARMNDEKVNSEGAMVTISDLGADDAIKLSAGKKKHALVKIEA